MCAAPAVAAAVLEAAQTWEGEIPGRDRVRIIMAGAPPPTKTVVRVEEELGWEFIQIYGLTETSPLLTVNRTRAEWDDLPAEERAAKLVRAGMPAIGVSLKIEVPEDDEHGTGEVLARSNVVLEGYWEQPEETERGAQGRLVPHRRRRRDRRGRLPHDLRPQEGRDHHRRRERLARSRSRTCCSPTRRSPRSP